MAPPTSTCARWCREPQPTAYGRAGRANRPVLVALTSAGGFFDLREQLIRQGQRADKGNAGRRGDGDYGTAAVLPAFSGSRGCDLSPSAACQGRSRVVVVRSSASELYTRRGRRVPCGLAEHRRELRMESQAVFTRQLIGSQRLLEAP